MTYRSLIAATCRKCGDLVAPASLKRDTHTWSGFQYLCLGCSRRHGREYAQTAQGRAVWQRRQSGPNQLPHSHYRAAHKRTEQARGKAADQQCYCGAKAHSWALLPLVPCLKDGPFRYSLDPMDYIAMCRPHHSAWDHAFARLKEPV